MQSKFLKGIITTAILASLAGCQTLSKQVDDPNVCGVNNCTKFTILHTNDNHGRFWTNSKGEYGMAARMTLIEKIRKEVKSSGGTTLLFSAGDVNTGTPESDMQDAEPDFKGMNLLHYDAMAVGNHEFDNSLEVLNKQSKWADFPMLAANVYDKNTNERIFQAYKIFNIDGVRVAVIGLTTEDTQKIGNPEYIKDIEFKDPQVEIKKIIKEINEGKLADLIVATTHMGHYADGKFGSNAPGDVSLARSLKEGQLQAIFGGHSHEAVCMAEKNVYAKFKAGDICVPDQQNGTYIMQAFEWGKYVGRADFEYYGGKSHLVNYELIPVNLKKKRKDADGKTVKINGKSVYDIVGTEIEADLNVQNALLKYQNMGQAKLDEKIGRTDQKLEGDRDIVRNMQTNLGHLLAVAQQSIGSSDFAIMNSGGVRDSIQKGDITYRSVLKVQPFGNTVTTNKLTGKEISDYLASVATKQVDSGAYAQIVGLKMTVMCMDQTVNIKKIGDKDYSPTEKYSFTVPSYNAAGGDGYPKISNKVGYVDTGYVDADALYEYVKNKNTINAAEFSPVKGDVVYKQTMDPNGCKLAN